MANWADEIKSDPSWKKANDWHYCTIPDGEKYKFQEKNGKAVEKVNEFINLLKNVFFIHCIHNNILPQFTQKVNCFVEASSLNSLLLPLTLSL